VTRRAWIVTGGSLALAAVLAIALVVVIATDDDSASGASGTPAGLQVGGQLPSDVQDCLAQKGIQLPQAGQPPSGNTDPQKLQQALQECGATPPSGAVPFGSQAPGSG
jgi:hypothetical protein